MSYFAHKPQTPRPPASIAPAPGPPLKFLDSPLTVQHFQQNNLQLH